MELANDVGLALQAAGPDAFLVVDGAGEIVFANDRVADLFGWTQDELMGTPMERLVPERFASVHASLRHDFAGHPESRRIGPRSDLWARRKDGSEFPVEVCLGAVNSDVGLLVGAVIRDVTDMRRATKRFEAIMEAAPDALVGVGSDGRIALANAGAERLFGWQSEDLVGQPIETLVPEALREGHVQLRDAYLREPRHRPMASGLTLSARRRDGTEFPAEVSLSALTDDPEDILVLAAVRDISDRLQVENERAERVREAAHGQIERLEALGQLAGGVAHDFNNLLGVILNYATLIARNVQDPQVRADVQEVSAAAQRGATLTRQLLTFARQDTVEAEPLEVNGIVRSVVSMLGRILGEGIELQLALSDEPLVAVVGRGEIEQIIVNLALNARDAMQGEGVLTITSGWAPIDHATSPGHVRLKVSDNGSGMGPKVLAHAFEPFFTTKGSGKGTGLGLSTVYGIVRRSGGDVSIESTEGEGSTVIIQLPSTDRAAAPSLPSEFTDSVGRERILLVEDEETLRVGMARLLREHGYHVMTAVDGVDALDLYDREDFEVDLVITDVAMPRMRGDQLALELAKREERVPLIYMSGYAAKQGSEPDATPSAEVLSRTNMLLLKPVDETTMLRAIRQALMPL